MTGLGVREHSLPLFNLVYYGLSKHRYLYFLIFLSQNLKVKLRYQIYIINAVQSTIPLYPGGIYQNISYSES